MSTVILFISFIVNRINGSECVVKDYEANSSPLPGSMITVKYNGTNSNGLLNEPVFWRQMESVDSEEQQKVD